MAIRKSHDKSQAASSPVPANDRLPIVHWRKKSEARRNFRKSLLESLEDRKLLAAGPQLIGVQPNNSDLIENGVVRDVAPRELVFRFDDSQVIDPNTTGGIRLTRSGGDGSFGVASAASDFGTNGRVDIQLTMRNPGQTLTVNVTKSDRGALGPLVSIVDQNNTSTLQIVLNSNASSPTTAAQLINAINTAGGVGNRVSAKINGGFADTRLGTLTPNNFASFTVSRTNDIVVQPGSTLVGSAPNENEVTIRFAEALPDDFYRIEVFGFDDAASGIVGVKNVRTSTNAAQLFQPTVAGTRQDTIDFRLDLGSKVTGVVPQPVVRNTNGSITQQRDTIVVYFDSDKLLVENDVNGQPTNRSAENPDFYQLIYTSDTVRNTDDTTYKPTTVRYNASNNSATLTFSQDIDNLRPSGQPRSAFRLRIGTRETIPFTPTTRSVAELGDTYTTADNLGEIGSIGTPLTSVILSSEIKTTTLGLDYLGASDDPGHRDLGAAGFENHINNLFGADDDPGITKIFYNFRADYASGFSNSITERQKERVREALQIWSNYLGVQFTESANQGITFSTGVLNALPFGPGVQVEQQFNFRARIDPTFNNGLLVMDAGRAWNDNYGEDYFRIATTAIGMLLGLEHAGDLPDSTLLSMNSVFLNTVPNATAAGTINFEPIFPGSQDILHGRYLHRPDNTDIDLYRFQIDFGAGGASRVGEFVAETFAERSKAVSSLDTNLRLYKQKQAVAVSNFNAVEDLAIQFTAKAPGQLGNHLQIFVTQSPLGANGLPNIVVTPNLIAVELNSTTGFETTAGQLVAAIQGNAQAAALVDVVKLRGADSIKIGAREIVYSPIELLGGQLELIAQNDDYFSEDSLLRLSLGSGVYYVGVSASGNDAYDPAIPNSGKGGRTEGTYELRMTFRAQTDANDTIQDSIGLSAGDLGRSLDGDADGLAGGVYDFWFETRALDRVLSVNNSGAVVDGQVITIIGNTGVVRRFELSTDASVGSGNVLVSFTLGSTTAQIASALAAAVNGQATLGVSATAGGSRITLSGDRSVQFTPNSTAVTAEGKTIFVDKLAGPNADGSQQRPFNNLQGSGVPNAFGSALPGDIVRIVGNGGLDGNITTLADNFAYEFGFGLLPGAILSDGSALEVPKGVVAMVDAGAIFKSRRSYIVVGSTNTGIDRSASNLQVLGTPLQPVYFTSWLDESIGRDNYGPSTTPSNGDWGGIIYQRDVDRSQGRRDKEDEGIFLNYVNGADMRYGGGGGIIIDATQQIVNPIQIVDGRATITNNIITRSADAAVSASPNSFEETLFTDLSFQSNGAFTPDYDRVGPDIHGNRLLQNSLNGLFIKVQTLPGEPLRTVSLPARFDDIDVTHILAENLLIVGSPGGSILDTTKPDVTFTTTNALVGGGLAAGTYNYRVALVDRYGVESVSSDATSNITTSASGSILVAGLPGVAAGYRFVRVYRSNAAGLTTAAYSLVAQLDSTQTSFVDRGQDLGGRLSISLVPTTTALRPRLDASLVIDPGAVLKLEGARIELGQGVQFLAEGTADAPIVITSKLDDRAGAGGTFDTNNDGSGAVSSRPAPGNWGGIYVSSGADVSIDNTVIAYGGGVTRLDGTFRSFNVLELQQGTARVANSRFEFNANGIGGQGPVDRFGRLNNEEAVIYARGTSPIFLNNVFENNSTNLGGLLRSSAITLDSNSLTNELQGDRGRRTGFVDRLTTLDYNRGPLFRGNSFNNNDINGLEIRADNRARNTTANVLSIEELRSDGLTVESVWDDTDIVHVLFDGIYVSNLAHASGLRLQSSPTESLVVKLSGAGSNFDPLRGSGFTAGGFKSSIDDRVGGTVHVIGQPGFPVVLTSLEDDTVGAGLRPDGKPQNDTNNNGIATIPRPGDWRGILLDQNSNDRNVVMTLEIEAPNAVAPGLNSTINTSQVLGQLAANANNSDENLRLGFVVKGVLSQAEDVDVYSFTGVAGSEVWIDIDHTSHTLDTVVELLDANGNLLARTDDSGAETAGTSTIVTTGLIASSRVGSVTKQTAGNVRRNANGSFKEDGTTNPRDAGFRVVLSGANGTRSGYFFRVRSASINPNNINGGLTGGSYEVQVRMREAQEVAGSLVTNADIRYATNGIHLRGLPAHSPLLGEASEDESVGTATAGNNFPWSYQRNVYAFAPTLTPISTGIRPQYVGNVLQSDRAALSVAGNISSATDVDFYRFSLTEADLVNPQNSSANLVFDLDYADGLNRADTSLAVYRLGGVPGVETWQLFYIGEGSNIADDQRAPLNESLPPDFTRGSLGTNDPFINTSTLAAGDYLVAVFPSGLVPAELASTPGLDVLRIDDLVTNAATYTIDLTGITAAQLPTFQFRFDDFTANYTFTINGVNRTINGSGNFTEVLALFAGTLVTVVFPALPTATPPAVPPTITGLVRLANALTGSTSERIPFNRLSTPQLNTLFTNPLSIATRQVVDFDLSGYVAADLPAAYFNYNLANIDYNVTIESSLGVDPAVFLTGALAPTNGIQLQAKIDLTRYAGLSGLKLVFTPTGLNPNASVSRVMVGLAERGESVTAPIQDQSLFENRGALFSGQRLFSPTPTPPTTQQTGRYQLEIRRVDATSLATSNDRDALGFGLVVPSAATISDGSFFSISDAAGMVEFEFNSSGGVAAGRVPINIVVGPVPDSAAVVAGKVRDAINSSGVQSRLNVQASGSDGLVTGPLTGNSIILIGAVNVGGFFNQSSSNLVVYSGSGDLNINRDQGQVVVSGNTIRQARDYGVWSEAGLADYDPRDLVDTYSLQGAGGLNPLLDNGAVRSGTAIIQARPRLAGNSPGAARNLQELNDDLIGGFNTGIVVSNNILENGGLGGIHIAGENPVWMISPVRIPGTDPILDPAVDHFGDLINDGDQFFIDSGRTRVGLEFEDLTGAGAGGPAFGSSTPGGDGWRPSNVPVYYREDGGATYLRSNGSLPLGYTALESIHALRDAIMGSILVTNGTTQRIEATVAVSLLNPIQDLQAFTLFEGNLSNDPILNWANRPALYLEGPTNIYYRGARPGNIWDIRRVDRANTPQPFARVVNNTVIGNDGRASFTFDTNNGNNTAVNEPNELVADAVQTQQGTAINPQSFTMAGRIGDNALLTDGRSDVDLYQFKLDIGDRVKINVDTDPLNQPVDTVLQIYDSNGRRVNLAPRGAVPTLFVDDNAAPGETLGIDPYIDFTATEPGVYFAAVSAKGNLGFDPTSTASRAPGAGTGRYSITLGVLQPNEFTITVDANANGSPSYQDGDTFTVYQVADLPNSNTNAVTFEFTTNANYAGNNVPVFFTPDYRLQDMARSIATAISNAGMNNDQNLENGSRGAANPLNPVSAVALGGASGVQPGLRLFPRRNDGVNPTHSSGGIGHDLITANGVIGTAAFGTGPTRADGAGTTEKFVVVRNAAAIESTPAPIVGNANRRSIAVDPDLGIDYNMNQLLPESGILISAGSSPTVLNNVFYNVQTPIVREETRSLPPSAIDPFDQDPLPFGTGNPNAADRNSKPGEIIVGGNSYQFIETQVTFNRNGYGIQASPTNIPNTQNDFNFVVPNNEVLFVNPLAGNWLPASGARIIDSSIDSLTERDRFNAIKTATGIAPSPILAPNRDAFGQLRVDDPTVAPPQGLGANVFKDRGALDNADFVGPIARLLQPIDNDSELRDTDPSISYVQLNEGVYPEFRIQLSDIGDSADPFPGVGIDDDSVVGPDEPPLRLPGTVLTISENGRRLQEGIDYVFAYNPTTKEIVLTPLAGVWRSDRVYEIRLNNRDRFVVQAPAGNLVSDGDQFRLTDSRGGVVTFEYESGYRMQLPTGLRLLLPIAGGGAGGVADGDQFTIAVPSPSGGTTRRTFEMDRNDNSLPGNTIVPFASTDNQSQLADKILLAISGATQLGLSPRKLADGSIFLGGPSGTTINFTGAAFAVPQTTIGLQIPPAGPLPGGVTDGQTFTISDGTRTITFEIDTDNVIVAGNQRVDTSTSSTASDVANQLLVALRSTNLNLQPSKVGNDSILLGLPTGGTVSVGTSRILLVGVSKSITDGQSFTVAFAPVGGTAVTRTFEFNDASVNVSIVPGNTPITISNSLTEEEIGELVADAITAGGLSLQARHVRNGNIAVGGTSAHTITINAGTDIGLFGRPGVTAGTSLTLQGTLVLAAPSNGGAGIADGSTLAITNNGQSIVFEFDSNGAVGPGRTRIPYTVTNTNVEIAVQLAASLQQAAGLALSPLVLTNGRVDIGFVAANQIVAQPGTGLTIQRGNVTDGESFSINNGTTSATFEFDNLSLSNGRTAGTIPILFGNNSTSTEIAASMRTAIIGAGLGLSATVNGTTLLLDDTPRFTYNIANARSLQLAGLAGGAFAVPFIQDVGFSGDEMRASIVRAINNARLAGDTVLAAVGRIGETLFVEKANDVSGITSYFLRGVQDLAGNSLRSNRFNNETQFTILMPGTSLDFGDAPDPFTTTSGRYSTIFDSNGARHSITGLDEVQVVGWTAGDTVTGTFTLTHGTNGSGLAVTTAAIPTNASAAVVQSALEGLSTIGVGNVLVEQLEQPSGSPDVTYRITFRGLRESLDVPQTTISLTSAGTPATPISTFEQTVVNGVSGPRLGRLISADADGRPSAVADTDNGDDGVSFSTAIVPQAGLSNAGFNKNVVTTITVTAGAPGLLDAWIDFNIDGAWDGPGEQIILSHEFTADALTQTFDIRVPATTAEPAVPSRSFARFRFSTEGGLSPTGLAVDGEVEDYDVTIVPGSPPVAVADNFTMTEDQVGGLTRTALNGLLANDTDPDPTATTRTVVDSNPNLAGVQPFVAPRFGTLNLNADGSFNYTPNQFFNGIDTFAYFVTDGVLIGINPATVTISVAEINNPPRVANQTINWGRDSVYDVSVSEFLAAVGATPGPTNESSQTLSITRVDPNSERNGTITLSGGRVVYTPPTGFSGLDTFTFLVADNGTSRGAPDPLITTGTVTFSLTDRNDPPTANPDSMSLDEDGTLIQPVAFFLANDRTGSNRDEAGQTLTLTGIETDTATRGSVVLNGGSVTYTPPANFTGTDVFFYNIADNGLNGTGTDVRTARGTVTVTVNSINDRPTVTTSLGTVSVSEDAADRTVDLNGFFGDVDIATANDRLTYTVQGNSRSSLVNPTINASTGVLNLDFLSDQHGSATIIIRATDLAGAFIDNTLIVNVAAVADSPRLVGNVPDQNVQEGAAPLDIPISPNFIFDPDVSTNGDTLTIVVVSNSNPSLVTTQVIGGTLRLSFAANQFGQSTLVVRGTDAAGQSITDTFVVNVGAVNDPPTVQNRSYTVPANGQLNANDVNGSLNSNPNDNGLLWNSTDIEGDAFNAVVVQQPTRGQLNLNANGSFVYTPNAGGTEGQTDTFTYRAVDSRGAQSVPATVTITFGSLNASPHQNPTNRFDVNADGSVSPIDALIVINTLNRVGSNVPIANLNYSPAPYCDVNGDRFLSPIDVLQVINQLNRRSSVGGEGESSVTAAVGGSKVENQLPTGVFAPMIVTAASHGGSQATEAEVSVLNAKRWIPMQAALPITGSQLDQSRLDDVDDEQTHDEDAGWLVEVSENPHVLSESRVDHALMDIFDLG